MFSKKSLAGVLSVLVISQLLLSLPAKAAQYDEFPNLIKDGWMGENNMDSWKKWSTGNFVAEKQVVEGDPPGSILHIDTRGTSGGVQQLGIPVKAGTKYQLTFSYQLNSGTLNPMLGHRLSNSDFAGMSDVLSQATGDGMWNYVRYFTVPQNFAGDFRLIFVLRNGEAYINEVAILDMANANSIGNVYADQDYIVRDSLMSLAGISSFKPWGAPTTLEKRWEDVIANNNGYTEHYMYLNTRGTNAGFQQLNLPVKAGQKYKLKFSYKLSSGRLKPIAGIRTSNSDFQGVNVNLLPANDWRIYERIIEIPQNFVGDFRLIFLLNNGEGFVDNIMLQNFTDINQIEGGSLQVLENREYNQLPERRMFALGTTDIELASYKMVVSNVEDVILDKFEPLVGPGGVEQASSLKNYRLFIGDQQVSGAIGGVADDYWGLTRVSFSGLNITLPKGQTTTISLRADTVPVNEGGTSKEAAYSVYLFARDVQFPVQAKGASSGSVLDNDRLTLGAIPHMDRDIYIGDLYIHRTTLSAMAAVPPSQMLVSGTDREIGRFDLVNYDNPSHTTATVKSVNFTAISTGVQLLPNAKIRVYDASNRRLLGSADAAVEQYGDDRSFISVNLDIDDIAILPGATTTFIVTLDFETVGKSSYIYLDFGEVAFPWTDGEVENIVFTTTSSFSTPVMTR